MLGQRAARTLVIRTVGTFSCLQHGASPWSAAPAMRFSNRVTLGAPCRTTVQLVSETSIHCPSTASQKCLPRCMLSLIYGALEHIGCSLCPAGCASRCASGEGRRRLLRVVSRGSTLRSQRALMGDRLQPSVRQSRTQCVQPSSGRLACRRSLHCRSLEEIWTWGTAAASAPLKVDICLVQLLACLLHCQVVQLWQAQALAQAAKLGAAVHKQDGPTLLSLRDSRSPVDRINAGMCKRDKGHGG